MNKNLKMVRQPVAPMLEELADYEGAMLPRYAVADINFPEANMMHALGGHFRELGLLLEGTEMTRTRIMYDTSSKGRMVDYDQVITWILPEGSPNAYGFLLLRRENRPSAYEMEQIFFGFSECCIRHQKQIMRRTGAKSLRVLSGEHLDKKLFYCQKHQSDEKRSDEERTRNALAAFMQITGQLARHTELTLQLLNIIATDGFADVDKTRREVQKNRSSFRMQRFEQPN